MNATADARMIFNDIRYWEDFAIARSRDEVERDLVEVHFGC